MSRACNGTLYRQLRPVPHLLLIHLRHRDVHLADSAVLHGLDNPALFLEAADLRDGDGSLEEDDVHGRITLFRS